jgi:hypothetical protein
MCPPRAIVATALALGTTVLAHAQPPRLEDVLRGLSAYLDSYGQRLAAVVAEEQYRQAIGRQERTLRSDYALTRAADKAAWVGYRDTFEVDGRPIRDREDRLIQLLTDGTTAGAARIAEESSRFNLANTIVTRNINVPTLVLEMLYPRNQWRFRFSKSSEDVINGTRTWRLEYQERERPTFIRNSNGRDRPTHGSIWVNPATGEVWRTLLTWDSDPRGTIIVTYGHAPNIEALVPVTMTERYDTKNSTLALTGDASYSNYRQFQTGARLVTGPDPR